MTLVEQQPPIHYLKDYQAPDYWVESIDLTFELHPTQTRVKTKTRFYLNKTRHTKPVALTLDGEKLILQGVHYNEQTLSSDDYHLTKEHLTLQPKDEQFTLSIETQIDPQDNKALTGLYLSNHLFCTQCESTGFRRITYYLDRPDVMARFTTTIIADKTQYPLLLSNGNCIAQKDLADGRHCVTWQDPFVKPAYLFALVAGNLAVLKDSFTTKSGKHVALEIYTEPQHHDQTAHAMQSLKKAMRWDEDVFGLEYDLDTYMIVAVNDFNMGAMENKGLNVFNAKYVLAKPETATDQDFLAIEQVIGHEYFHNWTGNRITLRDWFQLSLKEGLTVFRDQEFSSDMSSRAVKRIEDVKLMRTAQFAEDRGPMAHPVRPESYIEMNNFYTVTVYDKGAEVIRMLQTLLGKEGFLQGMKTYVERYDGKAITTDDFVGVFEDVHQLDLTQFRLWYSQAGTPEVSVKWHYDALKQQYTLELTQSCAPTPGQADKKPLHIPVRMGLLGVDFEETVLELKKPQQTFVFENIKVEPVVSLFRGFSAPVRVNAPYNTDMLRQLLQHDTDPLNRWDAGVQLATQTIQESMKHPHPHDSEKLSVFIESWCALIHDKKTDPALLAHILSLPTETYLAELHEKIDVDGIYLARDTLEKTVSQQLFQDWWQLYQNCLQHGDYALTSVNIAKRSLQGVALHYLMCNASPDVISAARHQLQQANNMTEKLSALRALMNDPTQAHDDLIQAFYEQWQHEPLVVNKWLSCYALTTHGRALENIKALTHHAAFQWSNPNKIYALLLTFAKNNPYHFHAKDGQGYAFIADCVKRIDQHNPQVAARLVSAFTSYRRYDEKRQALIAEQLQSMLKSSLSKDVYEVVSKTLNN